MVVFLNKIFNMEKRVKKFLREKLPPSILSALRILKTNQLSTLGKFLSRKSIISTHKYDNYQKYLEIREKNLHKMKPIPVCTFNE